MKDTKSKDTVKANICVGCCDMTEGGDPNKAHYCREAANKGVLNGFVDPVYATFKRGEKCRDTLCPIRKMAVKKHAA